MIDGIKTKTKKKQHQKKKRKRIPEADAPDAAAAESVASLFGSLIKERHWNFGWSGRVRSVLADPADGDVGREAGADGIAPEGLVGRKRGDVVALVGGQRLALGGQDALDARFVLIDDLLHFFEDGRVVIQLDVAEELGHQFGRAPCRVRWRRWRHRQYPPPAVR